MKQYFYLWNIEKTFKPEKVSCSSGTRLDLQRIQDVLKFIPSLSLDLSAIVGWDNFLLQHIDLPTRCRGQLDNPHILDLVISNNDNVDSIDHLAPLGKSDHSVLTISVNVCSNRFDAVPKLNFNKGNYSDLRDYLDIKCVMLYVCDMKTCSLLSAFTKAMSISAKKSTTIVRSWSRPRAMMSRQPATHC